MKFCSKCRKSLDVSEFSKDSARRDALAPFCRACTKAFRDNYLRANPERKEARKTAFKEFRERNQAKYFEILSRSKCIDCGESNPVVLEFDHIGDKTDTISHMLLTNKPWEKIESEMAKCQVRCANCHRIKTAEQRGWKRLSLLKTA